MFIAQLNGPIGSFWGHEGTWCYVFIVSVELNIDPCFMVIAIYFKIIVYFQEKHFEAKFKQVFLRG